METKSASGRPTPLAGIRSVAAPAMAPVPLDDLDLALLKELVTDGRASQRTLATALGVSAPTVGERLSRLERTGVITGYSAQVNWSALGLTETVFLSVTASDDSDVAGIMSQLWAIPEVQDVSLVTGDLDLLVRVKVRDHNHLRALLIDTIWQIPGIQGTATMTTVAEMPHKPFAADLIAQLQDDSEAQAASSATSRTAGRPQ